jgi:hypothetical protein
MKISECIKRINFLEGLVNKASRYIDKLEAENKELKKDRNDILEQFEQEIALKKKIEEENRKLKLKLKDLERENKVYKELFKDVYETLNIIDGIVSVSQRNVMKKQKELIKYFSEINPDDKESLTEDEQESNTNDDMEKCEEKDRNITEIKKLDEDPIIKTLEEKLNKIDIKA